MGSTQTADHRAPAARRGRVPVAFAGRTSTLALQDPVASMRRQLRDCQDWLPAGFVHRRLVTGTSSPAAWTSSSAATAPRIGRSPTSASPATAAWPTCWPKPPARAPVRRRDLRGHRAVRPRHLQRAEAGEATVPAGIPLFATDEPIDVEGMNATTLLVRRVKQGVAEWYRFQLKEKAWKGLIEHALDGWNIGPAPYGYAAERIPHPIPVKAAQGRTKTRLVLDPDRAPVVAQIFTWRTVDKLGVPTITGRLNADPAAYPPPAEATGWTAAAVGAILANPKYTGHLVFGRRRTATAAPAAVPPDQWLWTPEPVHPPSSPGHLERRPGHRRRARHQPRRPGTRPRRRRTYAATGAASAAAPASGACAAPPAPPPPAPSRLLPVPAQAAQPPPRRRRPRPPAHRQGPRDTCWTPSRRFFADRIFGPDRAALLAATYPATAADTRPARTEATRLTKRLKQIDATEDADVREVETFIADRIHPRRHHRPALPPHPTIHRTGRRTRHHQHPSPRSPEPTDTTPATPGSWTGSPSRDLLAPAPDRITSRKCDAFDMQAIYQNPHHQVTLRATITSSTPRPSWPSSPTAPPSPQHSPPPTTPPLQT